MRPVVALPLICCVAAGCGSERTATVAGEPGWWVHRNTKYGYEIAYPETFELWATGPEGERDGRSFRIARREYAAPVPVLDVTIQPTTHPLEATDGQTPDLTAEMVDTVFGGAPAKLVELRWKANGELAFVEVRRERVTFRFDPASGLRELEGTVWWKIVDSFRFLEP